MFLVGYILISLCVCVCVCVVCGVCVCVLCVCVVRVCGAVILDLLHSGDDVRAGREVHVEPI